MVGTWHRELKKYSVFVELFPFARLIKSQGRAFTEAGVRFTDFLGLKLDPQVKD